MEIQQISEHLKVDSNKLNKLGVFDAIVGIDSHLFVDPFFLRNTKIPEFKNSYKKFGKYFSEIITLLVASKEKNDKAWKEAHKRLIFHETHGVSIGYGMRSSNGSAIGFVLGGKLVESASEIIKMGITDPVIFELLGLFEEGFGADRLSDMTISILLPDFLAYTERVTKTLKIKNTTEIVLRGRKYVLPAQSENGDYLLFLPMSFLSDLPIALTFDDIDRVISANRELRQKINVIIGSVWKERRRPSKNELRNILFSNAGGIKELLASYKNAEGKSYDFQNDVEGQVEWYSIGKYFADKFKLIFENKEPKTLEELEGIVEKIIAQFKKNIELNGLNEHLYASGKVRPERFSQRLLYSTADTYCKANDIDLSREPDAGSGPVDFKLSKGYKARTLVEIKLSSNPKLIQGYEKQIVAYQESEDTTSCYYVVIRISQKGNNIKNLLKIKEKMEKEGKKCPPIVVIDGVLKPSASNRKRDK